MWPLAAALLLLIHLKCEQLCGGWAFPLVCRRALALIINPDLKTVGGHPAEVIKKMGGGRTQASL